MRKKSKQRGSNARIPEGMFLRVGLRELSGSSHVFSGRFERYGSTKHSEKRTVLLKNIQMDGRFVSDHLWMKIENIVNFKEGLSPDFQRGDVVYFEGTPTIYSHEDGKEGVGFDEIRLRKVEGVLGQVTIFA